MSKRTVRASGVLLVVDLSLGVAAMFVEALILPAIITTASSIVILGITGLVKLMHLKKATQIAALAEGEKKIMKKKLLPKLKAVAKYIFVSNPVTFFCATLAILLLAINGALGGVIAEYVLWFTSNELLVNIAFNTVVALLGLTGACIAGLESNEQADARKAKCKKVKEQKICEQTAYQLACEKLSKEQKEHFEELLAEARCELAEKAKLAEQEENAQMSTGDALIGYLNEQNIYVLTNIEGSPKTHAVTPETTRTAYYQAKQLGAAGFVTITHRAQYGFDEMADRYYELPASQGYQKL